MTRVTRDGANNIIWLVTRVVNGYRPLQYTLRVKNIRVKNSSRISPRFLTLDSTVLSRHHEKCTLRTSEWRYFFPAIQGNRYASENIETHIYFRERNKISERETVRERERDLRHGKLRGVDFPARDDTLTKSMCITLSTRVKFSNPIDSVDSVPPLYTPYTRRRRPPRCVDCMTPRRGAPAGCHSVFIGSTRASIFFYSSTCAPKKSIALADVLSSLHSMATLFQVCLSHLHVHASSHLFVFSITIFATSRGVFPTFSTFSTADVGDFLLGTHCLRLVQRYF